MWAVRTTHFANMAMFIQYSFVTLFLLFAWTSATSECGDYYDIAHDIVGNIYSPGYPEEYPPNSFCIWYISVPVYHRVELILDFTGERYRNACSDYVEVRDGSGYAPLLGRFCDIAKDVVVTSGNQWMWIKFKSDRISGNGKPMHAQFSSFFNDTVPANITVPHQECRSYEFVCRNKECVSMSYRCDGHNDCGCLVNCDESMCYGLHISKGSQVAIAVITGIVIFCTLCLITYCIEGKNNWIASQAEAIREKEILSEKQRQRASRAFSKFIGGEKDLLASVPTKSRMNLAGHSRLNSSASFR